MKSPAPDPEATDEGFVLVPRFPSPQMLLRGGAFIRTTGNPKGMATALSCWTAMVEIGEVTRPPGSISVAAGGGEVARDAARYRWLRECPTEMALRYGDLAPAHWDAAIDSAMAAKG